MKKILSLTLVALMVVSAVPTVFAADNTYDQDYEGEMSTNLSVMGTTNEYYTITIPAEMWQKTGTGQGGSVKVEGQWPSSKTLNVSCPSSVTLTNKNAGGEPLTVNIQFKGISCPGDDFSGKIEMTENIGMTVPATVYFGEWTGTLNYNVEFVTNS